MKKKKTKILVFLLLCLLGIALLHFVPYPRAETPQWKVGDYWVLDQTIKNSLGKYSDEVSIVVVEDIVQIPTTALGFAGRIKTVAEIQNLSTHPYRTKPGYTDRFFDIHKQAYLLRYYRSMRSTKGVPDLKNMDSQVIKERAIAVDDLEFINPIAVGVNFFNWPLYQGKKWEKEFFYYAPDPKTKEGYNTVQRGRLTAEVVASSSTSLFSITNPVTIKISGLYPGYFPANYSGYVYYNPTQKFWTESWHREGSDEGYIKQEGTKYSFFGPAMHPRSVDTRIISSGHAKDLKKNEKGIPLFIEELQDKIKWEGRMVVRRAPITY